jgi:DNA-binding GntR family transcriptional regulator
VATKNAASPTRDLGIEAYRRLKEDIRNGIMKPGARVTEIELSARLQMSRTPVREAVYKLESDGLVTYEPRRGLTITRPDHQMIMELYTMREALEGTAARLAAQHASDVEIEALTGLIESEVAYFSDVEELQNKNRKIHGLICLAAHNRFLTRALDNMEVTMTLLPTLLGDVDRARYAHEEHLAILDAVRNRDPGRAEHAARSHITTSRKLRLEMILAKGI